MEELKEIDKREWGTSSIRLRRLIDSIIRGNKLKAYVPTSNSPKPTFEQLRHVPYVGEYLLEDTNYCTFYYVSSTSYGRHSDDVNTVTSHFDIVLPKHEFGFDYQSTFYFGKRALESPEFTEFELRMKSEGLWETRSNYQQRRTNGSTMIKGIPSKTLPGIIRAVFQTIDNSTQVNQYIKEGI